VEMLNADHALNKVLHLSLSLEHSWRCSLLIVLLIKFSIFLSLFLQFCLSDSILYVLVFLLVRAYETRAVLSDPFTTKMLLLEVNEHAGD
jgi:hypothetical protein